MFSYPWTVPKSTETLGSICNTDDSYWFLSKSRPGVLGRQKFIILIRGPCPTSSEDVLLGRYEGRHTLIFKLMTQRPNGSNPQRIWWNQLLKSGLQIKVTFQKPCSEKFRVVLRQSFALIHADVAEREIMKWVPVVLLWVNISVRVWGGRIGHSFESFHRTALTPKSHSFKWMVPFYLLKALRLCQLYSQYFFTPSS